MLQAAGSRAVKLSGLIPLAISTVASATRAERGGDAGVVEEASLLTNLSR